VKQPHYGGDESRSSRRFQILNAVTWPLAIVLALHRTFITAFNGTATDDFSTVYNALTRALTGIPVYDQAYNHVDPLYLYNPGATLMLMPIGLVDNCDEASYAFIIASRLEIIAYLALLAGFVGRSLREPVFPIAIAFDFLP